MGGRSSLSVALSRSWRERVTSQPSTCTGVGILFQCGFSRRRRGWQSLFMTCTGSEQKQKKGLQGLF